MKSFDRFLIHPIHSILFLMIFAFASCGVEEPDPDGQKVGSTLVETPHLLSVDSVWSLIQSNGFHSILLIEVNKESRYLEEGHLPGALRLWRPDYTDHQSLPYGGMRPGREHMSNLMGQLGALPESTIVLYDSKGNVDAARVWWLLQIYGHRHAFLMDGGKVRWELSGLPLEKDPEPKPEPTLYVFPDAPDRELLAGRADVEMALADTNVILLDTRELEEYSGQPYIDKGKVHDWKPGAFSQGRIPGSIHLNWSDAVNLQGDHRFKSLKDLRYNADRVGLRPGKKIITYCQSGVRSAHALFVLKEILGYPDVQNYDGSWIEWSYFYRANRRVPVACDFDLENLDREKLALQAELDKAKAKD